MVFKSLKVLIATIGLGLGSAAIAENLVYYGTGSTGTTFYYDAGTVRKYSDNIMEFWTKADASRDKKVSWRTQRAKWRVDCSAETMGLLAVFNYRADGTVILSEYYKHFEMLEDPPGSMGEGLFVPRQHSIDTLAA